MALVLPILNNTTLDQDWAEKLKKKIERQKIHKNVNVPARANKNANNVLYHLSR